MDQSQPKTPDFSLDSASPPHFSYDFNSDPSGSPSGPAFDAFAYTAGFDTSPRLGGFSALALGSTHAPNAPFFQHAHQGHQGHNPYPATSPTAHSFTSASTSAGRPFTPLEGTDLATISPPLTLGHHQEGSYTGSEVDETTAHVDPTGRRSSTNSPPSSASQGGYASTRAAAARYNPMAGTRPARPQRRSSRRGVRRDDDDDLSDDDNAMDPEPMEVGVSTSEIIQRRREEIRRQRIESEQRRRDELRDGYAKLKYALPISNQKSSKVSLLDRAVTYIRQLETNQASVQQRLDSSDAELTRLRNVNEQLMRNLADQHRAVTLSALAAANAQASASANASQASSTASEPPSPPAKKPKNKPAPF